MKILLMGPMPPKYTGQAVAFSNVVRSLNNNKNIITVVNISEANTILKGLRTCLEIIKYVLFTKFEAVYFTCSRSFIGSIRDVLLLLLLRIRKSNVVNHLHGADFADFYDSQNRIYQSILTYSYKRVNMSIVLLDEMKNQFSCFPWMNICAIHNGYDSNFDSLPSIKETKDSIQLIYISNIMESKGIIYLLDAYYTFIKENKNLDIKLIIAGSPIGDYLSNEKQIAVKFLDKYNKIKAEYPTKIEYNGVIVGEEKINTLWESDIFILPTFYPTEAFPISIIEAMRAGNYIISTDHNYISNIISPLNGVLIKTRSEKAISDAIEQVVSDIKKMNALQNFNISIAQNQYTEELYTTKVLSCIFNNN